MRVILIRKVLNAEDRAADRDYQCPAVLTLPPLPGTSIMIDDRTFEIVTYKQLVGALPLVYLKADNTTFKGTEFAKQCQKMTDLGFTLRSEK